MSTSYMEVKLFFNHLREIIDRNRELDLLDSQTTIKTHEIESKFEEIVSLALEGKTVIIDEIIKEITKDIFFLGKSILGKSTHNMISIVETLLDDLPIDRKRTYESELKEIKNKKASIIENEQFSLDISLLKSQIEELDQILNELIQIKASVIKERQFNIIGSFKNAIFLIIAAILSFLIGKLVDDFLLFILILVGLICSYYLYQYFKRSNKKWLTFIPSLFTILIVGILKYPDYYPMIEDQLRDITIQEGISNFVSLILVLFLMSLVFSPLIFGGLISRIVKRKVLKNLAFNNTDTKLIKITNSLFDESTEFKEISFLLTCMLPIINISFQSEGVGVRIKEISPYSVNYIPENGINLKLHYYIPKDVPQMLEGKRKLILKMSGYFIGEIPRIIRPFTENEVRFDLEFDFSYLL